VLAGELKTDGQNKLAVLLVARKGVRRVSSENNRVTPGAKEKPLHRGDSDPQWRFCVPKKIQGKQGAITRQTSFRDQEQKEKNSRRKEAPPVLNDERQHGR